MSALGRKQTFALNAREGKKPTSGIHASSCLWPTADISLRLASQNDRRDGSR